MIKEIRPMSDGRDLPEPQLLPLHLLSYPVHPVHFLDPMTKDYLIHFLKGLPFLFLSEAELFIYFDDNKYSDLHQFCIINVLYFFIYRIGAMNIFIP